MKRILIFTAALMVCFSACSCNKPNPSPEPTPGGELAVPEGVCVTDVTENSLSYKWNAVEGAEGYSYKLLEGMTLVQNGETTATEVSFNGLKSETTYKFAVKSVKGTSSSKFCAYVEKKTLKAGSEKPDVPEPIENLYEAMQMPARQEDDIVRAFPGADGGGYLTTGGRSGRILHVTSLEDSNSEGTLRWAIAQKGARTIVFDVAGIISLGSRLEIKNGDVTIAGQTAPGDGICLKGHNVRINASNVIVRFLRFRMGDENAVEDDALNCYTHSGLNNVIIDHCSMSWSTDECGSFYGVDGFTLSWCILSESLRISVHGKGQHGYGGIWGGTNATFHHNLIAHHDSRNPRFDHDYVSTCKGPIHYYNNVVYNWGMNSSYGGESGAGVNPRQINMVANYYKAGPATGSNVRYRLVNPTTKCSNCNKTDQYNITPGKFYIADNYMYGSTEVTADNWKGVAPDDKSLLESLKVTEYQGTRPSDIESAEAAFVSVLDYAGASLRKDRIDARVAKEAKNGTSTYTGSKGSTGGLIDTQSDVGGWPAYRATDEEVAKAALDTDGDGIPDYYEALFNLDPQDASDAASKTIDIHGRYTNLEMYLHYLVREIVK